MIATQKTVNQNGNVVIMLSKTLALTCLATVNNNNLLSSPPCSSSPSITTKKAKQLQVMKINFQSIWGKRKN